jgi:hypothetical protein
MQHWGKATVTDMMTHLTLFSSIVYMVLLFLCCSANQTVHGKEINVPTPQNIIHRLQHHLTMLTRDIGERSVRVPDNLEKSAAYIQAQFESHGLAVQRQPYRYGHLRVSNVVAQLKPEDEPALHYVIGAHYDCVAGTVGADDNASSVAVLLETARSVRRVTGTGVEGLGITFVAFALEEPPVYGTPYMGSRVFAARAKEKGMSIDGMICLEMVGYTCRQPGCQQYPFPLNYFGYPETGTFIGIVGNVKSMVFSRMLRKSFKRNPRLPVEGLTVPFNGKILPAIRLSDHASFWDVGYRAVMITDSAFFRNPHYHRRSDTMETLDFDFMAEVVQSLATFLIHHKQYEM